MSAAAAPGPERPDRAPHGRQSAPPDRPLKPGQRHPTPDDVEDAYAECLRPRGAGFPSAGRWELTPEHAAEWGRHNFAGRRGDTGYFRRLGDLSADEFALLLWDLDCWHDLVRRGCNPPPLEAYLLAGREEWGWLGALIRHWRTLQLQDSAQEEDDE